MKRLDQYFIDYNKINQDKKMDIYYLDPIELVNNRRIDIIVKYYYIKSREKGENLEFAIEIYKRHIEAFSDGTFKEHGNKNKNTIENYIETFNDLIDDFKKNGFNEEISLIPIGKNNELLDGSHRVACALYFKEKVKVIKFPELSINYGFEFFRKRLLDEIYLDFIVKEYVKFKDELYLLLVWPKIGNEKNIKYIENNLKEDNFSWIYNKKLKFNEDDFFNLVFNIYKNEHWIGYGEKNFQLIKEKLKSVYDENGYLKIYLIENSDFISLINKKEELRKYFGIGKASIHTMDDYKESVRILNILLDENFNKILYQSYINSKGTTHTFKRHIQRKARYFYRRSINIIKKILGKPV